MIFSYLKYITMYKSGFVEHIESPPKEDLPSLAKIPEITKYMPMKTSDTSVLILKTVALFWTAITLYSANTNKTNEYLPAFSILTASLWVLAVYQEFRVRKAAASDMKTRYAKTKEIVDYLRDLMIIRVVSLPDEKDPEYQKEVDKLEKVLGFLSVLFH